MVHFRVLFTFLLILFFHGSFAQEPAFNYQRDYLSKFDSYTADDGLMGRKVLDLHEDRYGFIWIATDKGLNRFDGYDFYVYSPQKGDSTSISHAHVTSITEDVYGNLWVGTQKGLNCFDRKAEHFRTYHSDAFDENSLSHDYVRELYADSSGFLWIETVDGILSRYDIKRDTFAHYNHEKISQPYYEYHTIYEDRKGDLWIGGRSMGPYRFDRHQARFEYFRAGGTAPGRKRDNDVAAFLEDSHGNFWVSGIDGIYRFFPDEARFEKFYATSTYDIVEDGEGLLWFATGNGLLRFDPRSGELLHYRADQNNPHSLTEDDINCLMEDHAGNLWFGTDNGINTYSRDKYKFDHVYHIPGNKSTIASNHVSSLLADDKGSLWVGTLGYGLDKIDLEDGSIVHYKETDERPGKLASNYVSDLYQDRQGNIWVGLWRGVGFQRYLGEKDQFVLYSHNPDNLKTDWYVDFLEDSQGTFWAGFWGADGMQEFDRRRGRFVANEFNPLHHRPIDRKISTVAYDHHGNVWIGCAQTTSIYRYSYPGGKMVATPYPSRYRNCSWSDIRAIQPLDNGDLYIAASSGLKRYFRRNDSMKCMGIPPRADYIKDIVSSGGDDPVGILTGQGYYLFFPDRGVFEPLSFDDAPQEVFSHTRGSDCIFISTSSGIYCYTFQTGKLNRLDIEDFDLKVHHILYHRTRLYLGTKQGLWRYHVVSGKMERFQTEKGNIRSLTGNLITALIRDQQGLIWIGTTQGLTRFDPQDRSFLSYKADPRDRDALINNHILSLSEGADDDIWVGTSSGVCVLDKGSGRFNSFNEADPHSLTSRLTSSIMEDSRQYLWVGTSNKGLNRINPLTGLIDHFRHRPGDSTSLSSDVVHCLFEDSNGETWVGTDAGLDRFLGADRGFQRYSTEEGLPDDRIMAIQEDDQGDLWISTQNGLFHFIRPRERVMSYYKSDGLQSNRFTGAHCRLPDGRLAFGGENGITVFHPHEITTHGENPEIQITGFDKFDQRVRSDFTSHQGISLDYDENFFTVYFASMDFTAPEKNQYKYILEGVDDDWVFAEHTNRASYTDIKPGTYTFKVSGTNNDYVWTSRPATLQIRIHPPFWRTTWFLMTIGMIGTGILVVFVRLRIVGLKKEKFNIELEQKLLRSQMNPHFVFNSLTSIQNYVLGNHSFKASHYLAKFSKLLRLILENSRNNTISLQQEVQTLDHYLNLQKIRYDEKFEFQLAVDPSLDREAVRIPPMLTQPFVENAIEHGFKPATYKGLLSVRFEGEKDYIVAIIEDNGIGIERSKRLRTRKGVVHRSLATRISEERIENLNRFNKRKIQLYIEDLGEGRASDLKTPAQADTGSSSENITRADHSGNMEEASSEASHTDTGTRITLRIPFSPERES